jgi:protoporphyrinogen oxidase
VLDLLSKPTDDEQIYFSSIQYSSAAYVYCKAKTNLFKNALTIWIPEKEDEYFSAVGINQYKHDKDFSYFAVSIRDEKVHALKKEKKLTKEVLSELIQKQLGPFQDFSVIHIHVWNTALPKFVPGHITRIYNFLDQTKDEKLIFFCGDYLENPSTEGALTSAVKLVERIS